MAYKVKYPAALKAANITEADLIKPTAELLEKVKYAENGYKEIAASGIDEEKLAEVEAVLKKQDTLLCEKISKNNFWKVEMPAKLKAAKDAKKAASATPPAEPVVAPIVETPPVIETTEVVIEAKGGEVKKKDNTGFVVLGVMVSALGFAAIGKWQKWF